MKTIEERQKIFVKLIGEFEYTNDNSEIYVWDKLVDFYVESDKELKNKIYNTLKLLNEAKNESSESFEIFLDRDIENDIWYSV